MDLHKLILAVVLLVLAVPDCLALPAIPVLHSASENLALGKPVESNHPGSTAVTDGNYDYDNLWGVPYPAWLKIDLGEVRLLSRINVRFFSDGVRWYRYYVEVSPDGENWQRVIDDSERSAPTPRSDPRSFDAAAARYIRVTVPSSCQAWEIVHIYDVEVNGSALEQWLMPLGEVAGEALELARLASSESPTLSSVPVGLKTVGDVDLWVAAEGSRPRAWRGQPSLPINELVHELHFLHVSRSEDPPLLTATYADGTTVAVELAGEPLKELAVVAGPVHHATWLNPRPGHRLTHLSVVEGQVCVLAIMAALAA